MVVRVQSQRATFKPIPYQRTHHGRRIPGWLVLISIGIVIGALGIVFVQKSFGPKGLNAAEAQRLTDDLARSNIERQSLQTEIDQLKLALDAAQQKFLDSRPASVNQ
jgi:uncharacterized protein YlxW (UPF0749 family)